MAVSSNVDGLPVNVDKVAMEDVATHFKQRGFLAQDPQIMRKGGPQRYGLGNRRMTH